MMSKKVFLLAAITLFSVAAKAQYNLYYDNQRNCHLNIQAWEDDVNCCCVGSYTNLCVNPITQVLPPSPPPITTTPTGGTPPKSNFLYVMVSSFGNSTCTPPGGHTTPCTEGYRVAFPLPAACPNFMGIPDNISVPEKCGYCGGGLFNVKITHISGNDYLITIN